LLLVTLPLGVVTVTKPVVAPLVSDGTLKAAAVPLKDTLFVHLAGKSHFHANPLRREYPVAVEASHSRLEGIGGQAERFCG
jgi:hypothetical protein